MTTTNETEAAALVARMATERPAYTHRYGLPATGTLTATGPTLAGTLGAGQAARDLEALMRRWGGQFTVTQEEDGSLTVAGTLRVSAVPDPSAPTGLVATAASAGAIDLAWAAGTGGGPVDEYAIERSPDGATYAAIGTTAGDTTAYADTGLAAETEYTYRVRALNQAGYSAYCAPDSATTDASGPAILAADDFDAALGAMWTASDTSEMIFDAGPVDGVANVVDTGANAATYTFATAPLTAPVSGILGAKWRFRPQSTMGGTQCNPFALNTAADDGQLWSFTVVYTTIPSTQLLLLTDDGLVPSQMALDAWSWAEVIWDTTGTDDEARYYVNGALVGTVAATGHLAPAGLLYLQAAYGALIADLTVADAYQGV